jgi:intein-encoded DNA endonuclease-like protein
MLYRFVTQPLDNFREYIERCPKGFLRGFFTAEGSPTVSIANLESPQLGVGVTVSNSDSELLELARNLLVAKGLHPGKIRIGTSKGEKTNLGIARNTVWMMSLSGFRDVVLFADLIGFETPSNKTN